MITHKVIHIETPSPNEVATGKGTTFKTADGVDIPGVRSANIRLAYDKATVAELTLFSSFSGAAKAKYVMYNPNTGELAEVVSVQFADGTYWNAVELTDATHCGTPGRARVFIKGNEI
jgi:hypothetical protein